VTEYIPLHQIGHGNRVEVSHMWYVLYIGFVSKTHTRYALLRSEDAFVITCVANLMEVKVLYVQQDLRYEISSYWRFNV
jgi:hypothetical protein